MTAKRLGIVLVAMGVIIGGFGCRAPEGTPSPSSAAPTAKPAVTTAPAPAPTTAAAPAPTAAAAPAPAPTTGAAAPAIQLKLGSHKVEGDVESIAVKKWVELVNERAKGRLQITAYYNQSLVKNADAWDAVSTGIVPIVTQAYPAKAADLPLADAMTESPHPSKVNWWIEGRWDGGIRDMINKDLEKLNAIEILEWPSPAMFIATKKPYESLDGLKGLKVRSQGGIGSKYLAALGLVPIEMSTMEALEAAQRGLIDAISGSLPTGITQKWFSVTPYTLKPSYLSVVGCLVMNLDQWKKIPADLQSVMLKAAREAEEFSRPPSRAAEEEGWKKWETSGGKLGVKSPEDQARWVKAMQPVWDEQMNKYPLIRQYNEIANKYAK